MRQIFSFVAFVALLASTLSPAVAGEVQGVRVAALPGGARLVISLTEAADFTAFALARPARVVVDLPRMGWRAAALARTEDGVTGLRHGQFRPDVYRLVFDLQRPAAIKMAALTPVPNGGGERLLIDISYGEAPSRDRFSAAGVRAAPTAARPRAAPTPPRRPATRVVVLDAGHGGVDPGAIGVGGVVEKRVNLAVAKAVKRRLEARPGYTVVLTRNRDAFLRLRERVRRGRAAKAHLFISLHADSHPDRKVAGASLYTLSETASDKEAARLARSENKADLIGGVQIDDGPGEVFDILLDLTQRETQNLSSAAADDLLFALAANQPLLARPKRSAGFAVLKAPDVPSVLIELGFLSNAKDAKRLGSEAGRNHIAAAIADGVFRFFDGANTARARGQIAEN